MIGLVLLPLPPKKEKKVSQLRVIQRAATNRWHPQKP